MNYIAFIILCLINQSALPLFTSSTNVWQKIQEKSHDAVVQVFVETAQFNWKEPYKSPDQDQLFGSGFFINDQGFLVSNFHVIEDATRVMIQIPSLGKQRFACSIIGACPDRDISLLKLTESAQQDIIQRLGSLPVLELGSSDDVKRTDEILALGYPLGQEKLKSTQGIVSGRENVYGESFIQITAALNPGNSGGPSLARNGKVIGMNTARVSSAQNIGYIIPIDDLKSVIKDLTHTKLLRKPLLGCSTNYATNAMISYLKNPSPGGLYVARIYKNSLLEKIGIQAGDMLYAINGHKIDMYGEINVDWSEDKIPLSSLVNRFELGTTITLDGYRSGKKFSHTFPFTLSPPQPIRMMYPGYEKIDYEIFGGIVFMNLALNHIPLFEDDNPTLSQLWRAEKQNVNRVIITHIFGGSSAHEARIVNAGDIVEEINGKKISTLDDLRSSISINKKYLTLKTSSKKYMVLDMKTIVAQEDELTQRFYYKKSTLYQMFEPKKTHK